MANLNRTMIIGNIGKEAELKFLASGTPQCAFSVAVNSNRKNKSGEWESETEWFSCILWGDQAERLAQYLTKGKQVFCEGSMRTHSWDGNDGVKHYKTELNVQHVQLLDKAPAQDGAPQARRQAPVASSRKPAPNPEDSLPWE